MAPWYNTCMSEPESPEWAQRPGEPAFRVTTVEGSILLQVQSGFHVAAIQMRPAVAEWLGEQIVSQAKRAKLGLIIPNNGGTST